MLHKFVLAMYIEHFRRLIFAVFLQLPVYMHFLSLIGIHLLKVT